MKRDIIILSGFQMAVYDKNPSYVFPVRTVCHKKNKMDYLFLRIAFII